MTTDEFLCDHEHGVCREGAGDGVCDERGGDPFANTRIVDKTALADWHLRLTQEEADVLREYIRRIAGITT